MTLDSIVLENFAAYGGRQEAMLTPKDGKPIILFGGMNGGGKTTLLDAVQLAFYGTRARTSNRGRLGYKDYLRESIHRGVDPGEGAGVTVRFRRMMDGETRHFELQRLWRQGIKGIEETVRVLRDGELDEIFTAHWDEAVESYLPSGIAHLFFFDGEQIKDLAEGDHAASILGTAIHSLLGLDLVDRLEADLKLFERRKKTEGLDSAGLQELALARRELDHLDREQEATAMEEGAVVNEAGRLAKEVRSLEEQFRSEGGELFLRRQEIEDQCSALKERKNSLEAELRELAAGPLPLNMIEHLLTKLEAQARREGEIRLAKVLSTALEERDREVLKSLKKLSPSEDVIRKVREVFDADRQKRRGLAAEPLLLDADESLPAHLSHLRAVLLPNAEAEFRRLDTSIVSQEENIARLEGQLARVPSEDRIAGVQREADATRNAHESKLRELEAIRLRRLALQRQRETVEGRLDRLGESDMDARFSEDARLRMLKHSARVRETLTRFRATVVRRHTSNIEALILESFRKLLRKTDLITGLTINPETFEPVLAGSGGRVLHFDRLSAGERQLLATSMLWGLARASGRPIPTIIDTPLGRLDSSHRRHLVERYFPNASHQVLLLSTDEEIVGDNYEALKPFIARTYFLDHNEASGQTTIKAGYFET